MQLQLLLLQSRHCQENRNAWTADTFKLKLGALGFSQITLMHHRVFSLLFYVAIYVTVAADLEERELGFSCIYVYIVFSYFVCKVSEVVTENESNTQAKGFRLAYNKSIKSRWINHYKMPFCDTKCHR